MKKRTTAEIMDELNLYTMNNINLYTTLIDMARDYVVEGDEPDKLWFAAYMLERWFEEANDMCIRADYWYRIIADEELMKVWELVEQDFEEMVEEEKDIYDKMVDKDE